MPEVEHEYDPALRTIVQFAAIKGRMKKLLMPCILENTGHFIRTNDLAFSATVKLKGGGSCSRSREIEDMLSTKCHLQTLHPDLDKLAAKRLLRRLGKCEHALGAGQYQGVSVHSVWCGKALWLCE